MFTCAIIMGHYAFMNISEESQRGTGLAFETVSYIAEAFVYAYLGASLLGIQGNGLAIGFAALVMTFLPLVRAAMVYLLPAFYHIRNRLFPVKPSELKVCWYSGMVRGVIAFALGLQVEGQHEDFVVTVVLFIVLITTILGSTFLKTFCGWIGLESEAGAGVQAASSHLSRSLIEDSDYRSPNFDIESGDADPKEDDGGSIREKLTHFENQYMKPLFKKQENDQFNYDIEMVAEVHSEGNPPTH